jgi:hypothetical protein
MPRTTISGVSKDRSEIVVGVPSKKLVAVGPGHWAQMSSYILIAARDALRSF